MLCSRYIGQDRAIYFVLITNGNSISYLLRLGRNRDMRNKKGHIESHSGDLQKNRGEKKLCVISKSLCYNKKQNSNIRSLCLTT